MSDIGFYGNAISLAAFYSKFYYKVFIHNKFTILSLQKEKVFSNLDLFHFDFFDKHY